MKLLFISLGCDKNLVDSEEMLGMLAADGHEIVDDEDEAEVIIAVSYTHLTLPTTERV